MNGKYAALALGVCMSASIVQGPVAVFADTAPASSEESIVTSEIKEEAQETISLSYEDAYKKFQTSKTMELLNLKKQSDASTAKGYSETVSNYNKQDKENSFTYDSTSKALAQARRTFANKMIDANHQARLNGAQQELFQTYYTLKNTEAQLTIAKESVELKVAAAETAQRKYNMGTISKRELETAQQNAEDAQVTLTATENQLRELKQNLNTNLGYDISQELILTSEIEEVPLSETKLEDGIKSALENRNELKEADYSVEAAQLNFNNYKAYPSTSSKYINAKTQLLNAEIAKEKKPAEIELDVKNKYNAMTDAYNSVQTAKAADINAEESLKSTQRKYELGMATSTDIQQAQLAVNNGKLTLTNALLTYNLAVESYDLSTEIGCNAVSL